MRYLTTPIWVAKTVVSLTEKSRQTELVSTDDLTPAVDQCGAGVVRWSRCMPPLKSNKTVRTSFMGYCPMSEKDCKIFYTASIAARLRYYSVLNSLNRFFTDVYCGQAAKLVPRRWSLSMPYFQSFNTSHTVLANPNSRFEPLPKLLASPSAMTPSGLELMNIDKLPIQLLPHSIVLPWTSHWHVLVYFI